jgi:hypothetical protein
MTFKERRMLWVHVCLHIVEIGVDGCTARLENEWGMCP